MSVTVTTQSELDAALAAGEPTIYIHSRAGVWLTIRNTESSHVVARGSSHVVARESSHVVALESSHVEARGSSHVVALESSHVVALESSHVEAWGSSHVEAWGSSHVEAWESSHVEAGESSHVVAWGSSHVEAQPYVAVHLHSQRVTLSGGVVIDMTTIDESDPQTWCDLHGASVVDGVVRLFKALDENLTAGHDYIKTKYPVGKKVTCKDWSASPHCGNGIHLGPTTSHATDYRREAKRWVRVEVPVTELVPIMDGGTAKCKVKSCKVVAEVDRWGDPL